MNNYFPVEFMAELSKKEANGKKPIYGVHKWFGRKTDAVVRSILVSLCMQENNPDAFKSKFYSPCNDLLKGKIILDPFMGGGITLINTLRMGGKAIGADVNPVAWFITKNELQIPEINGSVPDYGELVNMLSDELKRIEKSAGALIKEAYRTRIKLEDGSEKYADIMYVFWVKKVKCPECGTITRLFPKYNITKIKREGFDNINICPKCGEIVTGNHDELTCKCGIKFNVNQSSFKSRKFKCSSCGGSFNIINDIMKEKQGTLDTEMYAIEYYDAEAGKKGFKRADTYDIENFKKIKSQCSMHMDELGEFIPSYKIPQGFNTRQVINHNYKYWSDMFNERQLLFLSKLLREIKNIENPAVKEIFLCIFSNTLNANNMFSIYNSQYGKIEPLFGDHHMAPVMNPVENNIWGTKYGRGSFIKNFNLMLECKKYNYEPFERNYSGNKRIKVCLEKEKFYGKFTEDFEKLKSGKENTILKCCSAESLSFIPTGSIDAVVTDPPYYSAINYGEISEFFYSWQRLLLKECSDVFKPEHICIDNEVTVNHVKGIEKDEFQKRLTVCFGELYRVLKPEGPMILTYNNSSIDGWCVLFNALYDSGFSVSEVYPVYMEYNAGLIENRRQKMNYDLVIWAVKKTNHTEGALSLTEFILELGITEQETMRNYRELELNSLDSLLIRVGVLYKLFFKYYPNIYDKGKMVEFEQAIKLLYKI